AQVWHALPKLDVVIACSVAGAHVCDWLEQWWRDRGDTLRWLTSQPEQCGVRNSYRDPHTLGADRWAALIAARHQVQGSALVVNAGTAITINALSIDGAFLGGLILPGLDLMAAALATGTARLPHAPGAFAVFPDNTADAIAAGAIHAVCGAIERIALAMAQIGNVPQLLLSGGGASTLQPHLAQPALVVPHLVLEGLRVVALDEYGT
ncbi:MAG: type III pantothenate kinase, partial [Betaproteobacteria bacterium]